jgi:tRNA threonylcarbamoyladenosine modification (KEOPS) complex  Pcc1 subunit
MKNVIKTVAALLVVSAMFTFCTKEEKKEATTTTTTTTSTTSTTGTGTGNTVTVDGTTFNLTTTNCRNEMRNTISIVDSVTVITGALTSGSDVFTIEAVFFSPNVAQGVYNSVEDDLSMAAGKCRVTILRSGSVNENMNIKANQQVTVRVTGSSRRVEISSKVFDYTTATTTGNRTVSTNYGCN